MASYSSKSFQGYSRVRWFDMVKIYLFTWLRHLIQVILFFYFDLANKFQNIKPNLACFPVIFVPAQAIIAVDAVVISAVTTVIITIKRTRKIA